MKCLINETLFFDTYIWLWWVRKILLAQKNRISDNGYCITCIKKEVFPIFLNIVQIFWILFSGKYIWSKGNDYSPYECGLFLCWKCCRVLFQCRVIPEETRRSVNVGIYGLLILSKMNCISYMSSQFTITIYYLDICLYYLHGKIWKREIYFSDLWKCLRMSRWK